MKERGGVARQALARWKYLWQSKWFLNGHSEAIEMLQPPQIFMWPRDFLIKTEERNISNAAGTCTFYGSLPLLGRLVLVLSCFPLLICRHSLICK